MGNIQVHKLVKNYTKKVHNLSKKYVLIAKEAIFLDLFI